MMIIFQLRQINFLFFSTSLQFSAHALANVYWFIDDFSFDKGPSISYLIVVENNREIS